MFRSTASGQTLHGFRVQNALLATVGLEFYGRDFALPLGRCPPRQKLRVERPKAKVQPAVWGSAYMVISLIINRKSPKDHHWAFGVGLL